MVQNVKVIVGAGSINKLGELLKETGRKKLLIVCDEGILKAGLAEKAAKSVTDAGLEYAFFSNAQADPPAWTTVEGIKAFHESGCDCVAGIGGGSSIDTAKAINILRFNEGNILDYANMAKPMNPAYGLISIPTTAGTGSELSDGVIISEGTTKYPIIAPTAMSEYAILDPELMTGLPRHITASTGMDAFTHAAEAYISNIANIFTDDISEKVMEIVVKWLPIACDDPTNLKAREQMCVAATIGGWMLGQAHSVSGHSLAHAMGGVFHVPHGFACAYAIPHVLEYDVECEPEKVKWIGNLLGANIADDAAPAEIGAKTRDAVIAFRDGVLGLRPARDFKPDMSLVDLAADAALKDGFQFFNPRKMTHEDAVELFKIIFA